MKRKFLSILMIMFALIIALTNVHAADGLFNMGTYSDIYKLSEQAGIDLPFINIFMNTATYDKDVKHSGISIGQSTIDVDEKLEGMHIVFTSDMVSVKGEVENALLYGNNVVIEGKITGDTIIIAPNVQILESAIVEKDVIIVTNSLNIEGTVNGNVIATVSEKANISGKLNSDLRIITTDLTLENSEIKGDVYIETNTDTTKVKELYPNAVIVDLTQDSSDEVDVIDIVTKGIITVIIYSVICLLLTKKENNIIQKACSKFRENTVYGLVSAVAISMLLPIILIVIILLGVFGVGIVAWPLLIVYAALILFVATTSMLIVGMAIFDAVKGKVGKFKIPVVALIYIVLYALAQITYISIYANMAMYIIALGIVITMITKKLAVENVAEEKSKI